MKLEAVALEDCFGATRDADVSQNRRNLSGVDRRRRHEYIERDGKEPERSDVELTGLIEHHHQ